MGGEDIRMLMDYIDRSLDQRFDPINTSMEGITHSVERIFTRIDELSPKITRLEGEYKFLKRDVENNKDDLKDCQIDCKNKMAAAKVNCENKMTAAKDETGTLTKLKVMVWVLGGAAAILLGTVAYFLSQAFEKIK